MKLAFTIADAGHAIHVGGQTATETHIVEVPDSLIPKTVLSYLKNREKPDPGLFWSMSVSVVVDEGATQ